MTAIRVFIVTLFLSAGSSRGAPLIEVAHFSELDVKVLAPFPKAAPGPQYDLKVSLAVLLQAKLIENGITHSVYYAESVGSSLLSHNSRTVNFKTAAVNQAAKTLEKKRLRLVELKIAQAEESPLFGLRICLAKQEGSWVQRYFQTDPVVCVNLMKDKSWKELQTALGYNFAGITDKNEPYEIQAKFRRARQVFKDASQ